MNGPTEHITVVPLTARVFISSCFADPYLETSYNCQWELTLQLSLGISLFNELNELQSILQKISMQ